MPSEDAPLLIAFVGDLFFAPRIEGAARRLGFRVQLVERAGQIAPARPDPVRGAPGEPLRGPLAAPIRRLASERPALLIFDLNNDGVPWFEWIAGIKSSPATRRIPVLCFGSHAHTFQARRAHLKPIPTTHA